MRNVGGVLVVFFVVFESSRAQWTYTMVAYTTDGRPCLANCIQGYCIVNMDLYRFPCVKNGTKFAPRYRTAQRDDETSTYCVSNCGYFGYDWDTCFTSVDGNSYDLCNSGDTHVSAARRPCKERCAKHGGKSYYWCYVEGGSWEYCAPPREPPSRRWQLTLDDNDDNK